MKTSPSVFKGKILSKRGLPEDFGPTLMRKTFEELGGIFLKLGQMLATRFDYLPHTYCLELFKLLDSVPPFDSDTARKITELELDTTQYDIDFPPEPIASASFGQVYEAVFNNRIVIIKVQRPEIEEMVKTDLFFISIFVHLIDLSTIFGQITIYPLFNEMRGFTLNELDYVKESTHAKRFYKQFKEYDSARAPRIFAETKRVLVMEKMEGTWVDDLFDLSGKKTKCRKLKKIDKEIVSKTLLHNTLRQTFEDGFFHADPHPANILVLSEGVIGYIDFGIVGNMPKEFQTNIYNYFFSLSNRDINNAFKNFVIMVNPPSNKDLSDFESEFKGNVSTWFNSLESEEDTITQKSAMALILSNMNTLRRHNLKLPEVVVSFYRTLSLIDIIFQQLSPNLNILDEMRTYFAELTLKRSIINEPPEKIIQILVSWHELIHKLPEQLQKLAAKQEESQNTKSSKFDLYSSTHNIFMALSWLSVAILAGVLIVHNKSFLTKWVEMIFIDQMESNWIYVNLALTFVFFQWIRRLLSRKL